jgi:hypothetical protein
MDRMGSCEKDVGLMGTARRWIAKIAVVGLAAGATLALGSPAKAADPVHVKITNHSSWACLAVGAASESNAAAVVQWTCNWEDEQEWILQGLKDDNGAPTYEIKNMNSKKCLAIGQGSTALGAKAIQWECNRSEEQRWKRDSQQRLRNMNSDFCLAIPGASETNGVQAIQWTCKDTSTNPEQEWEFTWGI